MKSMLKKLIFNTTSKSWAKEKRRRIKPFIKDGDKIIDIGAGKGALSWSLMEDGYDITPVDVKDLSYSEMVNPLIYDGERIPFEDDKFDVALLITVLHHTPDPEKIIKEAKRVAKRVIIIEDVYNNNFEKYATWFMDSLLNWQFSGHPHTNMKDKEWKDTFKKLGLTLKSTSEERALFYFKQNTYYLER
ncbi:class I SAM-dependent methyltransferase [Halonatronum saccharophilum]|uniref:class I SAM-dependent methyltransferase n=1 Tax=Halonatronum saccharophilum TaxID=150060 RepID=UPI0004AFBABD|nr:class I SAM-dependent methyltransferase [Halonatronum saccharophilum]